MTHHTASMEPATDREPRHLHAKSVLTLASLAVLVLASLVAVVGMLIGTHADAQGVRLLVAWADGPSGQAPSPDLAEFTERSERAWAVAQLGFVVAVTAVATIILRDLLLLPPGGTLLRPRRLPASTP